MEEKFRFTEIGWSRSKVGVPSLFGIKEYHSCNLATLLTPSITGELRFGSTNQRCYMTEAGLGRGASRKIRAGTVYTTLMEQWDEWDTKPLLTGDSRKEQLERVRTMKRRKETAFGGQDWRPDWGLTGRLRNKLLRPWTWFHILIRPWNLWHTQ